MGDPLLVASINFFFFHQNLSTGQHFGLESSDVSAIVQRDEKLSSNCLLNSEQLE
jgi:hypothetical protein